MQSGSQRCSHNHTCIRSNGLADQSISPLFRYVCLGKIERIESQKHFFIEFSIVTMISKALWTVHSIKTIYAHSKMLCKFNGDLFPPKCMLHGSSFNQWKNSSIQSTIPSEMICSLNRTLLFYIVFGFFFGFCQRKNSKSSGDAVLIIFNHSNTPFFCAVQFKSIDWMICFVAKWNAIAME